MRKYIRILYKALVYLFTIFLSKCFTHAFKLSMWFNGVEYGKRIECFNSIPKLQINRNSGRISVGNNVMFNSYTDHSWNSKCKIIVLKDAMLTMDDNSGINGVMIYCAEKIVIGKYVNIGGGTRIFDSNHHSLNWQCRRERKKDMAETAPIIIGDDVFIGAGCMIEKGVTIGARSIVAAGSVVVRSIPPDEIWGGNPAKFIRKL